MSANNYPFLNLVGTMAIFFAWVMWFWLLFMVFGDLFGRRDISGWAKLGWTVFVLVLPFVGVLTYLITQSRQMAERRNAEARAAQAQFDEHVRMVAASSSPAEQIAKAKELQDSGVINLQEYETLKQKALTV